MAVAEISHVLSDLLFGLSVTPVILLAKLNSQLGVMATVHSYIIIIIIKIRPPRVGRGV